jgi:hypothetical protein
MKFEQKICFVKRNVTKKTNLFLDLQNTFISKKALDSPILLEALQIYNPESDRDILDI